MTIKGVEFDEHGNLRLPEKQKIAYIKKQNIKKRNEKKAPQLKNNFFKKFIHDLYHNQCRDCGTKEKLAIHHERYNWTCLYEEKNKQPDCEECQDNSIMHFWDCVSAVVLLCRNCHTKRHKQLKIITNSWVGFATTKRTKDGLLRCKHCDNPIIEDVLYCPKCSRKTKLTKEEIEKMDKIFEKVTREKKGKKEAWWTKRFELCSNIQKKKLEVYFKSIKNKENNKIDILKNIEKIQDEFCDDLSSNKSNKELEEENEN